MVSSPVVVSGSIVVMKPCELVNTVVLPGSVVLVLVLEVSPVVGCSPVVVPVVVPVVPVVVAPAVVPGSDSPQALERPPSDIRKARLRNCVASMSAG